MSTFLPILNVFIVFFTYCNSNGASRNSIAPEQSKTIGKSPEDLRIFMTLKIMQLLHLEYIGTNPG